MNRNKSGKPKVVVIGAGSLFFGRQSIWQMVHSPYLNHGTLALVDTDVSRLDRMVRLARMVAESEGVDLTVEGSVDRCDVLDGADFVVLSFAEESVRYRGIDCAISEKYGIRMCSGDTIGPGGIFRAMRELPVIFDCAKDIEAHCPEAWVINYINPTAVHGIALKRYAPSLKSFALCDGLHMPHIKRNYAIKAGIISNNSEYTEAISQDFDMIMAGVNHFTWMLKAEYRGRDMMPALAEYYRKEAESEADIGSSDPKEKYNNAITVELYLIFGVLPTCVWHTKEYVRFWQGLGKSPEKIPPLTIWDTEDRYRAHAAMWAQVDDYLTQKTPISDYMKTMGSDHATDIIESMVGGLGKQFYINTFNCGAVPNMDDKAFLEFCCDLSLERVKPLPAVDMPRGLRGMQELVLDAHELTVEAVAERSFDKLRRAMMTDPLVNSIGDADNIIKEIMTAEKDRLPAYWFK